MAKTTNKKKTKKEKEKLFLEGYDSTKYEKPSVAIDLLIFTIKDNQLQVFLMEREKMPFQGQLALPGVFVGIEESLEEAVKRGLKEKASLKNIYFEQLYTWGEVERDPRMRIISVSYMALVPFSQLVSSARKKGLEQNLYTVDSILTSRQKMAFDHKKIIAYGRERIKNKAEYSLIAFQFLEKKFTLPQLQLIYEIMLGKPLYKANFRKKIQPFVKETEEFITTGPNRPSRLYERASVKKKASQKK